MKISEKQLVSLIKESVKNVLSEGKWRGPIDDDDDYESHKSFEKIPKKPNKSMLNYLEEGTTDSELDDAWVKATELMGAEGLLDALYRSMGEDEIREHLEYIDRMHELNLFSSEEDDIEL